MTHTPGPWYAEGMGGIQMDGVRDGYMINSAEQRRIAVMHVSSVPRNERWPNANLIAAAPDLLAALEEVQSGAKGDSVDMWLRVEAAIKKAKGL